MKKIKILFLICFCTIVSVFAQNKETICLSYEKDIVIKIDSIYYLIELQSFKVDTNKIIIKGYTICSFELENLIPSKIKMQRRLISESLNVSQIWIKHNGGLDKNNNRIWIGLNMGNLTGVLLYDSYDNEFDYPIF